MYCMPILNAGDSKPVVATYIFDRRLEILDSNTLDINLVCHISPGFNIYYGQTLHNAMMVVRAHRAEVLVELL